VRNQSFVWRKVISAGLGKACLMARRQVPVPGVCLQVREFLAGPPEETKLQNTGPARPGARRGAVSPSGIALASKILFGAISFETLEPQRFCG
jgi:hypothetical protein